MKDRDLCGKMSIKMKISKAYTPSMGIRKVEPIAIYAYIMSQRTAAVTGVRKVARTEDDFIETKDCKYKT